MTGGSFGGKYVTGCGARSGAGTGLLGSTWIGGVGAEMVVGGDTAVEVVCEGMVVVDGGTVVAIVGGDVDVVGSATLEVVVVTVSLTVVFEPHAVSPSATRTTPTTAIFVIAWPFMPKRLPTTAACSSQEGSASLSG